MEEAVPALTVVRMSHAVPQHGAEPPLSSWLREAIVAVSGKGLPQVNRELPRQLNEGLSGLLLTRPYTKETHMSIGNLQIRASGSLPLLQRAGGHSWDGQTQQEPTTRATWCPLVFEVARNYTFFVKFQRNYFIGL